MAIPLWYDRIDSQSSIHSKNNSDIVDVVIIFLR